MDLLSGVLIGLAIGVVLGVPVVWFELKRQIRRARVAERRARNAERLAEIGAMTAGLAHEIKNPLSTIGLNAQLLAESISDLSGVDEDERAGMRRRVGVLQREAELPRYLAPARGLVYQPVLNIQNVLLTGGTGFLGAYVIAEILTTTNAEIHCLVRLRRGENSKQRIENQMKRYQVWAEDEAWQSAWENR
ncbi:MAG: SDR family oxidoreductase, partial [Phycisphaerales bacterium]